MHFKQESISDKRYRRPNTFNCVLVDHMFHVFTAVGVDVAAKMMKYIIIWDSLMPGLTAIY